MINRVKNVFSILLTVLLIVTTITTSTVYAAEKQSKEVSTTTDSTISVSIKATNTGIQYTTDGTTWKSVYICDDFNGFVYDSVHSIYIGVGNYGAVGSLGTYNFGAVYTSTDGIKWSKGNCPSSYNLYSIATDGKGTVVIGGGYIGTYGIETHVYTTNNGSLTWKETINGYYSIGHSYRTGTFIGIVNSIYYGNGSFTVIGKNYNSTYYKSSSDGYTWK